MSKRLLGVFLLLLPLIGNGGDKEKKTYELIYQDVQLLKKQLLELKENLAKNSEDINLLKEQAKEVLNLIKFLQTEQASLKEDQKKIPTQYQILLEKIESLSLQLVRISEQMMEIKVAIPPPSPVIPEEKVEKIEPEKKPQAPVEKGSKVAKKEPIKEEKKEEQPKEKAPPPTPLPAQPSPKEVFDMAMSDYLMGNFELAVAGFKMYKEQFSDSPLVDDSLYWTGECYFSLKKFEEAVEQFNELILNYPKGDKVPAAYLKKGISLAELGKNEEALSAFRLLVSKYPLEEETKIAQQKIKELTSKK
jgi:tol-pal system protein YbgF